MIHSNLPTCSFAVVIEGGHNEVVRWRWAKWVKRAC